MATESRFVGPYPLTTQCPKRDITQVWRKEMGCASGFFLENALCIHVSPSELEMVGIAWHRYDKRHFQFPKER